MDIVIVTGDEWQGLYRDGVLCTENHILSGVEVVTYLGGRQQVLCNAAENALMEDGYLPKYLSDIRLT